MGWSFWASRYVKTLFAYSLFILPCFGKGKSSLKCNSGKLISFPQKYFQKLLSELFDFKLEDSILNMSTRKHVIAVQTI